MGYTGQLVGIQGSDYTPEKNLIRRVLQMDELTARIPRFQQLWRDIEDVRNILAQENENIGRFTRKTGFSADGTMQRVAMIPVSLAAFIKDIDPEFFKSSANIAWLVREFPVFSTSTKV